MVLLARYLGLCFIEARPQVQIIFLMRFAAGALLCAPGAAVARTAVAALAWGCATVAIYVFNGVADRVEDMANGSSRPIARGDLPAWAALGVSAALAAAACAGACWEGGWAVAVMVVYLMVGYCYSGPPFPFKSRYYAASIGGGALGLLSYLGGAASTGQRTGPQLAVYAAMMTLWMGGVGGIAKDLSDVAGDRAAGRRTWPVVLGERRARLALRCTAVAVAAVFTAVAALTCVRLLWCAGVVLLGATAVCVASRQAGEQAVRPRRRLPYRAFMWTQYLSHAALMAAVGGVLPA